MFKDLLSRFWPSLKGSALEPHSETLRELSDSTIDQINQGDLSRWLAAYEDLPNINKPQWVAGQAAVTVTNQGEAINESQLEQALRGLIPWRKGPFQISECFVDAEWRSDHKWNRLLKGLPDLRNRTVLDVGCGNGYYLLKMAEHQPRVLLGIEPGILQNVQFWSVEKFAQTGAAVLPLKVQNMPANLRCFDVVFSMGVLYHRKSPIEHLEQLKSFISPGGTLVMETLVIDGDTQTCLVPAGRYAQMRNVWFLPSVDMLCLWLKKVGFKTVEVIDISYTSTDEQRSTDWMLFHSLSEFLTSDHKQTVEGYPPPKRVIITCQK